MKTIDYIPNNGTRGNVKELCYDDSIVERKNSQRQFFSPFHTPHALLSVQGKILADGTRRVMNDEGTAVAFEASFRQGKRHGTFRHYYRYNPQETHNFNRANALFEESEWVNGIADGEYKCFFPDGSLREHISFKNGEIVEIHLLI
jgi:antitoxin component YwqK of YwqJK toxin-antitoxin module